MTDSPATIAALIQALDAAITRLGEATSFKQRKARNQVVINNGLALHDRLQELTTWLAANFDTKDDDTYLANEAKYREGWKALDAAMEYTREYKRLHYEELKPDDRRGTRSSTRHHPRAAHPSKERPLRAAPKADGGAVLRTEDTRSQRPLL
jgi:hypothetical protein